MRVQGATGGHWGSVSGDRDMEGEVRLTLKHGRGWVITTRDRGVKDTFNPKNTEVPYVWLLLTLTSEIIWKGEGNLPKNVFKGLKIDFSQAALNYIPSLSFSKGLV